MRDLMGMALAPLALALGLVLAAAPPPAAARAGASPAAADAAQPASDPVIELARAVIASGDNGGLPFAIVDKVAAQVAVFGPDGDLRGFAPALLGSARGDDSAPGVGDLRLSAITPDQRTTPAGRFLAGFGPAAGGDTVLWVDYATAISLHPVVTANRKEKRLTRLASASPADNRITYGCINVSAAFYRNVVRKAFTRTKGVVYVLPETMPAEEVFPALRLARAAAMPGSAQPPSLAASEDARVLGSADAKAYDAAATEVPASGP